LGGEIESLLQHALAPVEPPEDLLGRVTGTLQNISDLAAEELEGWELAAMRDPRNWVRPAVAVVGGAVAGAGLLALRMHKRSHEREIGRRATPGSGAEPGAPPGGVPDSD
jgi:hypothetical protein